MIENYHFGRITIDGKTYSSDIIIFPNRVQGSWWRERGHSLSLKDIEAMLALKPEVLIVGTGNAGLMKVPSQVANEIRNRGIELIVERTANAIKTYNRLCKQRFTVGAFHLTC